MPPTRTSSRRRARGQALAEFAVLAPVVLGFAFILLTVTIGFEKAATNSRTAQTLAEWIARTGSFDAAKAAETRANLDANPFATADGTYLHIVVVAPVDWRQPGASLADAPVVLEIGQAPGGGGSAPADTGWGSTGVIENLPNGSAVFVEVWSNYGVPGLPGDGWWETAGRAAFEVLHGA